MIHYCKYRILPYFNECTHGRAETGALSKHRGGLRWTDQSSALPVLVGNMLENILCSLIDLSIVHRRL